MLCVHFVAAAFLATAGWSESTLIERSLHKLERGHQASDSFDFIVVGDSNTLKPLEQSDVFKSFLRDFNILKPPFVIHIGDIVLGGAAEGVPAQWDLFDEVIAVCEPPFLPLPGNHDISDAATEALWRERIGPTHYTFTYGNSLFILMNSEEVGAAGRISDEQVAWLETQLASNTAENIFVFLHQPHFEKAGDPDTADAYWDAHWSNVAQAFQGHPVRAVFAGHRHGYLNCGIRDGVQYVICGGAATYGLSKPAEEGAFNHFLHVRVRGSEVSWAVMKPDAVLPEDVVTSARMDELHRVRNMWIAAEEVCVPLGEKVRADFNIAISNPHDAPMNSTLTWTSPPGWTVHPAETAYEVAAQNNTTLTFRVEAASPEDVRFPVPTFHTLYDQTQFGPPVEVVQDLKLVPVLRAIRAQSPITIDGILDEWQDAQWMPLVYPVDFDGKNTDDLSSQLAFQWDGGHLYLVVETQDNEFHQPYAGDIVWSADNVEMFLDAWSWGLSLTEKGPEVFLYWGVGVAAETVNTDVQLAVKRDGTRIVYEAAFPASCLTPLQLAPGNSFRYNVLMNDLDPSGPETSRHWLQLVPERGTPGSQPPRVKVVLQE
jgi:hypothetical protein